MHQAGEQPPLVLPSLAFPGRPGQGSVHVHPPCPPQQPGDTQGCWSHPSPLRHQSSSSQTSILPAQPSRAVEEGGGQGLPGQGLPESGPRSQLAFISAHKVLLKEKGRSTNTCSPVSWEYTLNA